MHFGDKKRKAEHINSNAIKDADAPLESVQYRFKTADAPMLNQRKNKHVMMKRKFKQIIKHQYFICLKCFLLQELFIKENDQKNLILSKLHFFKKYQKNKKKVDQF